MGVESLMRWLRDERARDRHRKKVDEERKRKILDRMYYEAGRPRIISRYGGYEN